MKKRFRKIIIAVVLLILSLFVINLIVNRKFLTESLEYGYEAYGKKALFQELFKPEIQKELIIKSSFGNAFEQISINSFNDCDIFIWNIKGFQNIQMDSLLVGYVDNFDEIVFNPNRYINWGMPQVTLSSKMENLQAEKISVNLDEKSEVQNHLRGNNFLILNLKSNGVALYNSNFDYLLKLGIDRFIEFEICFLKDSESFKIILLKPNQHHKLTTTISNLIKPKLLDFK
ncbi:MAG: hypothetical protein CMC96_14715 [Flavobacteriales bacterium]|nr:hypothetical protein [Flavobacteriales bacterium]|tara:strand:+ start:1615 stop:2304 length:690 start_codon:yes stop_codon:yes gene_type:complete